MVEHRKTERAFIEAISDSHRHTVSAWPPRPGSPALMAPAAADILANALEQEARAHDRGALEDMDAHIEAVVRRKVAAIHDIPRSAYKLALRFWKEWARAAAYNGKDVGPISESDWPAMARAIAAHVRTGTMPCDRLILDNVVRKRRPLLWRDLKALFDDSP